MEASGITIEIGLAKKITIGQCLTGQKYARRGIASRHTIGVNAASGDRFMIALFLVTVSRVI